MTSLLKSLLCFASLVWISRAAKDLQKTECPGNIHLNASDGYIQSPNYPNHYSSSMRCVWTLTSKPQHVVRISILDFDLDSEKVDVSGESGKEQACVASVSILFSDFLEQTNSSIYCGSKDPFNVTLHAKEVKIIFSTTWKAKGRKGFRLKYSVVPVNAPSHHGSSQKTSTQQTSRHIVTGSAGLGLPVGLGVVAMIIVIAGILLAIILCRRRRKRKRKRFPSTHGQKHIVSPDAKRLTARDIVVCTPNSLSENQYADVENPYRTTQDSDNYENVENRRSHNEDSVYANDKSTYDGKRDHHAELAPSTVHSGQIAGSPEETLQPLMKAEKEEENNSPFPGCSAVGSEGSKVEQEKPNVAKSERETYGEVVPYHTEMVDNAIYSP